ncbi:MAG: hypothetical protein ACYCZY_00530 [Lacisediminihabitans sp.]
MSNASSSTPQQSAVVAGEALLAILKTHIDVVASGRGSDEDAEEIDRQLWEAVGVYGDALDELDEGFEDEDDAAEPDELRFTVRTRYDYTVVDEKAFLTAGKGIGAAVVALLERAGGKPLSALEVASLETGSGLLTVHVNNEPLVAEDFRTAEEPTDLLLIAPGETLSYTLDEPLYESRAEAEAAARQQTRN